MKYYLLILSLITALTACSTRAPHVDKHAYMLKTPKATDVKSHAKKGGLLVENTTASPEFSNHEFVYHLKGDRYTQDFYNGFFTSPDQQVTRLTYEWLKKTKLFEQTLSQNLHLKTTYVLKSTLRTLEADYSDKDKPAAVVKIDYMLVNSERTKILWQKTFEEKVPLKDDEAETLVNAWNTAMAHVLTTLSKNLSPLPLKGD